MENREDLMTIDLSGPDGNAFALLSYAKSLGEQLEYDVSTIHAEMKAGDYKNLIKVFKRYFGDLVFLKGEI